MVGRLVSYWKPSFLEAMLDSGSVTLISSRLFLPPKWLINYKPTKPIYRDNFHGHPPVRRIGEKTPAGNRPTFRPWNWAEGAPSFRILLSCNHPFFLVLGEDRFGYTTRKLTCLLKRGHPQKETHIPTINFQVLLLCLREGTSGSTYI